MNPEPAENNRAFDKAAALKIAGLAAALGVAAWFLAPLLLPVKLPPDFPSLPNLQPLNPEYRALLESADRDARRKPGSAEAVGKLGMVYHANLLYSQAASAYRIAARLAPTDFRWTYCQAVLNEENGAEKEQSKLLQATLRIKPDHVPALVKLADSYFKVDRLDDAARNYELAAKAPDASAALQASFGLGRVAARRRDWNRVIEIVAPLTSSYPHAAPLYELLQEAYEALGQAAKAAEARQLGAAAKWRVVPPFEDPLNDQLAGLSYSSTRLLKQAGLLSRTGQADRAIDFGRRATQADPKDPDVRHFLARTLLTFYGDKPEAVDEALAQVEECLRLRPEDPIPLGGFADDFFKSPKPRAAVARLRDLLRAHPGIPGSHFFLGLAAGEMGETEEAVAEYRAALKENPKNSAVYNKLGLIAERAGRSAEAVAHFQKAIQLSPANTAARLNLAIELIEQGNSSRGIAELEKLLQMDPHDAAAHFCMGFAFLSTGRIGEAIEKFRDGLRYKPDDAEAHFGLGSAFAAQGNRADAVAELRETLRLRPNHSPARQLLSQLER